MRLRWDPNRVESQKLAVHAALLRTGKIVYFSGDEHDPGRHYLGKTQPTHIDSTRTYDCATGTVGTVASPVVPAGAVAPDLFCCGHSFLGDGRLLVAGGTESWTVGHVGDPDPEQHHAHGHFTGHRYAWLYDPGAAAGTNPWKRAADMLPQRGRTVGGGRWYPTLVTVASGQSMALFGHPATTHTGEHNNLMVEVFNSSPSPLGQWADKGDAPYSDKLYPRLFLLPNGEVFSTTPIDGRCRAWQAGTGAASIWRDVVAPPVDNDYHGFGTTAVLLPLLEHQNYEARILLCGGADPVVIKPLSAVPAWVSTSGPRQPIRGSSSRKRTHGNAVILPTMDVMVCGGFDAQGAVREVELYHPNDDSWTTLPDAGTAVVARNYHSVALLMPDGRVWTAGGNDAGDWSYHRSSQYQPPAPLPTTAQDPGVDNRETQIEIFEPPYFGRPDRPQISSAPASVAYTKTFTIGTPQAGSIGRVALIRAGSVTHAFNGDQRYIGLRFTRGQNELYATAPPDGNVAPPGYYLLFIVSLIDGVPVPSVGAFVRVGAKKAKFLKEFKPEVKEFVVEGKPFIKEPKEFKFERFEQKHIPDIPDPKLIREGFDPMPEWLVDPSPLLRELAERVDELEGRLAEGRAFIRPEERPDVGEELLTEATEAENAEALLAAREEAEARARETYAKAEYRPAPAEEHEHGAAVARVRPMEHGHDAHVPEHAAGRRKAAKKKATPKARQPRAKPKPRAGSRRKPPRRRR